MPTAVSPKSQENPSEPLPFRACTIVPAYDGAKSLGAVVEGLREEVPEAAEGLGESGGGLELLEDV